MFDRMRLIPVTVLAAALLFGLKLGAVWQGASGLVIASAGAQAGKAEAPAKADKPAGGPEQVAAPPQFSKSELDVLQSLAQRREALEGRSRELDMRENLLAAAEKRIDERIAELKKLEARVKGLIQQRDDEAERNIRSLVKVYENMKPKDAARIFEKLDMGVLLDVVERMKEAKLAPVLAEMSPTTAQKVTVELATRRAVPTAAPTPAAEQKS